MATKTTKIEDIIIANVEGKPIFFSTAVQALFINPENLPEEFKNRVVEWCQVKALEIIPQMREALLEIAEETGTDVVFDMTNPEIVK